MAHLDEREWLGRSTPSTQDEPQRRADAAPVALRSRAVQRKASGSLPPVQLDDVADGPAARGPSPSESAWGSLDASGSSSWAVQTKGGGGDAESIKNAAEQGVTGSAGALPHLDTIQRSFGRHDVSGVRAHTGSAARAANESIGSQAYAAGNDVAFRGASPDLHTTAHEAAHVVQQRGGVQLKDGVGRSGDEYEQHADAVADAVVEGRSAEGLLDRHAGGAGGGPAGVQGRSLQFLGGDLSKPLGDKEQTPGHGSHNPNTGDHEDKGYRGATDQRRYTVEQYIEMWEKERGRKMTEAEKETLARGCIGITALNLEAVNPPLDHAYGTFEQAMAVVKEWNAFIEKHKGETLQNGQKVGDYKAFLFAKLFWSNQGNWDPSKSEDENRKNLAKPDDNAFKPDPKTGRVDMSGYKYQGQPNLRDGGWYVNFDYGFWDEDSQCFWHANHAQPGMKVYQSTKEKFSKGYIDFDRIVFCAAIARVYKPQAAAARHG